MRILFLTNNDNTQQLVDWLRNQGESITIFIGRIDLFEYLGKRYLLSSEIKLPSGVSSVEAGKVDCIISYNYRYIIPPEVVAWYRGRIINLHIGYLPWNRGVHPNVWAQLDGTPSGVTIHWVDEGIDTGEIIAQVKMLFSEDSTLAETYEKLNKRLQELFKQKWSSIRADIGTYHSKADFESIKHFLEPEGWDITIGELKRRWKSCLKDR